MAPSGPPTRAGRVTAWIRAGLLCWFLVLHVLLIDVGMGDNGDNTQVMSWLTPKPAGFEVNWPDPAADPETWRRRFGTYWIRTWDFDPSVNSDGYPNVYTSVVLLWLPGAGINWLLVSRDTLYIQLVSLVPRVICLLFLIAMFRWIDRMERGDGRRLALTLALGVPTTLALSDGNYVAYFNSWYQEPASFVFLLATVAALVVHRQRRTTATFVLAVAALLLVSAARASNFYLPLLAMPVLLPRWRMNWPGLARTTGMATLVVATALIGFLLTAPGSDAQLAQYDFLFDGILELSAHPGAHLSRMGLADLEPCVGIGAYDPRVDDLGCIDSARHLNRSDAVGIVMREPAIALRGAREVTGAMQEIHIGIGMYSFGDPRAPGSDLTVPGLQLWTLLKRTAFPAGLPLLAALAANIGVCMVGLRRAGTERELAIVGLFAALGTVVDMGSVFAGDGLSDLRRHLFLANVLFDVATVATVGVATLVFLRWIDAPHRARRHYRGLLSADRAVRNLRRSTSGTDHKR